MHCLFLMLDEHRHNDDAPLPPVMQTGEHVAPLMLWIPSASLFASNRRLCSMWLCGMDGQLCGNDDACRGSEIVGKLFYGLRLRPAK
jgi:hypothetical protein